MVLRLENVSVNYESAGHKVSALNGLSLEIPGGQFLSVIGETGSGKSTFARLLNGLLAPSSGRVIADGQDIREKGYDLRSLRSRVGLVFQYPEHQLFEEDVISDVSFGPRNMGLKEKEAKERAIEALKAVSLDESCYMRSPFMLSGGEKRRCAIAGVLAMRPEVLVLDEPTAGLDPGGAGELLDRIGTIRKERGMTVILVSHNMDEAASRAERIIVLHKGKKEYDGTPKEVFRHVEGLKRMGLRIPEVSYVLHLLRNRGLDINTDAVNIDEAIEAIISARPFGH